MNHRRARLEALGVCITCAGPRDGVYKRCRACIDADKARRSALRANGGGEACRPTPNAPFCLECIASGGYHRVGCPTLRREVTP